jgi:hypothetical protein
MMIMLNHPVGFFFYDRAAVSSSANITDRSKRASTAMAHKDGSIDAEGDGVDLEARTHVLRSGTSETSTGGRH